MFNNTNTRINMSLFEQASLIVTPNAQKAGKLYSIKPGNGAGDLDVVRATTKTRTNSLGVIENVPINVPALDYTNGSCPSILVEPQRTNLLTNSDGNLATYTTNSNVSDAVIPINGFTNSIQFGDNSVSRVAYKRNFTPTIGVQYTLSVFVQMDDNSLPIIGLTNSTGDFSLIINGNTANINLLAQRVNDTNVYKCSASFVAITTNTQFGVAKFLTQSAKGFRITGIQLEAGSNATSYIPTLATAVTRNADVISKTGISDLIGQTEGTLFADFDISEIETNPSFLMVANLSNNNSNNRLGFARQPNGGIHIYVVTGGVSQFVFNTTQTIGLFRLAITYKANDYAIYLNGTSIYTNTSASVPISLSRFDLGNLLNTFVSKVRINKAILFKTRLSNAELQQLTTL